MKITIITDEEFQRLKSNLRGDDIAHFEYGLSRVSHIFGHEFVVNEYTHPFRYWRNEPFVEYRVTDDDDHHWRIPEWLVADINNEEEEV